MALKTKYFDPKMYSYKVLGICILMILDIFLNSFTQFLDFGSTNIIDVYLLDDYEKDAGDASYAFIAIQFLIQLLMIFVSLSIFSQTFFFKYGLVRSICRQFKFTFIFIFVYPFIFLAERFLRIVNLNLNFRSI